MSKTASTLRCDDRVVLLSCYELGHEPLGLVVPAGVLARAGIRPRLVDLAIENLDDSIISTACFVGISVPMHTALRLGVAAAGRVRQVNPGAHICFYGIYAQLNADYLEGLADSCLGPESEALLPDHVRRVLDGRPAPGGMEAVRRSPNRGRPLIPDRSGLRHGERYVKLHHRGELHRVGNTASSRGCRHLCRHCPLPPVYNGSFYAIALDDVMADIDALVERGAQHITFSDPDFLNGPTHARRVAAALHQRHPRLSFDYTAKVEHLRRHPDLVEELQRNGNLFVVSAVESLNDDVLLRLDKGHTSADVLEVFRHFASIGLALRPTFVPFTPWETLESYAELVATVEAEGLVEHVDPVQLSVRLLVPPGSLLEADEEMRPFLGRLDRGAFTWRWTHPDPRMDDLQRSVERIAAAGAAAGDDPAATFGHIRDAVFTRAQRTPPVAGAWRLRGHAGSGSPPRLTEAWFC